jgi:2-amino-4-hydroxy-6-hydroxymethyldihydropteridine diphosphokinase
MNAVFLSLGSNVGNRRQAIDAMFEALVHALCGTVTRSRLLETEPLDVDDTQQWYLNCVVAGGWNGTAYELLDECQSVENRLGRVRTHRHSARTADIDILLFGNQTICDSRLHVPHPEIVRRRFCLEGLAELAPAYIIPGTDTSVQNYYTAALPLLSGQRIRAAE